jgi:hypothetical protein
MKLIRQAETAEDAHDEMARLLALSGGTAMNVVIEVADMSPHGYTLETELFPMEVLKAYTAHNLTGMVRYGEHFHFSPERGGAQGDYSKGMPAKVERVVLALKSRGTSKRAVLTVPFTDKCSVCVETTDDAEWKCLREVYFSVGEDGRLHATGIMRSQALSIFAKNIHFIGELMQTVAERVGVPVGSYVHFMHFLVMDRK